MPLFDMIISCSMLFDSSKHCNLMLFLQSLKLLLLAILPCVFEHVLVFSWDSPVFMFCYALPVNHFHAFCSHIVGLWHVVLVFAICLLPVLNSLSFKLVSCVCWTVAPFWVCSIWNFLRTACSFILSCCIHVLRCLLDVWVHFASIPCLTCFAHIF